MNWLMQSDFNDPNLQLVNKVITAFKLDNYEMN